LFRGGAEQKIRKTLIEGNYLDAVVGLPTNLFFGTGIPAAILIFNKARKTKDVLFIDASKEYQEGKKQNTLRMQDLEKVETAYKNYETIPKYAFKATLDDIKENDYNLNIPRYVDTFEEEEKVDIKKTQKEIEKLEEELGVVRKEMNKYLKELGY